MLFTPIFIIASAMAAADCDHPQLKDCTLPEDVRKCVYPSLDADGECKAGKTGDYPLMQAPGSNIPMQGCYNQVFARTGPIPGSGKCDVGGSPFRLTLKYTTKCLDNEVSCVTGASVEIQPRLDIDGATPHAQLPFKMEKITLSQTLSGDPVRNACLSLAEAGYTWDSATRRCIRGGSYAKITCESLGLLWQNDKCVPLCKDNSCSEPLAAPPATIPDEDKTKPMNQLYCAGYLFTNPNPGKSCSCEGVATGTTKDVNGLACGGS